MRPCGVGRRCRPDAQQGTNDQRTGDANLRPLQCQIQPTSKLLESRVAAQAVENGFGQLLDAHGAHFVCFREPYERGLAVTKPRVDYGQVDGRNEML